MAAATRLAATGLEQEEVVVSAGALGRQAFWDLERWLCSGKSAGLALQQIEIEEERRGREMLRLLLQAHINARGYGDVGAALRVAGPDGSCKDVLYTHKRPHRRRLITILGRIFITRVGYGRPGASSVHPLDAQLQLPARAYSYEVQRRLIKATLQGPFDEARDALADATGVVVPKRSAEQLVIDAAVDFDAFYDQRRSCCQKHDGPILVGSVDCKGIPMVKAEGAERKVRLGKGEKRHKKRMATVATVFTQQPNIRTLEEVVASLFATTEDAHRQQPRQFSRPERKRVWASLLAPKQTFIADVREEMRRRDRRHRKTWVVVTDGERALQRLVGTLLKDVLYLLDLLHVLEKLWAASYVFHPEGSPEAEAFVRERTLRILRGGVSQVVKGFRQMVTKRGFRGQNRKTLLDTARYFYRNRQRMRYQEYLRNGLPIASGSVEGACKNLIKDRMERSGIRWTPAMAEAMLRLRAAYLSGDFDAYWGYHVRQEQVRLHSHQRWHPVLAVVPK
ncbi:MAG: ISKra4 family transposase [Planctomycetota bacterium]